MADNWINFRMQKSDRMKVLSFRLVLSTQPEWEELEERVDALEDLAFAASPVQSVFGRIGDVAAEVGDYAAFYDVKGSALAVQSNLNTHIGDNDRHINGSDVAEEGQVYAKTASGYAWEYRMNFRGGYDENSTYLTQDVVLEDGWTMVANKTTQEYPAPQPEGDLFFAQYGDPPPTTPVNNSLAGVLLTGARFIWDKGGYFSSVRYFIPPHTLGTLEFIVAVVLDAEQASPQVVILRNWFTPTSAGVWLSIGVGTEVVFPGTVDEVLLGVRSLGSTATFTYDWGYKRKNGDPGEKECWHQNNGRQIRFNQVDESDTNRSSDLDNIVYGSTIDAGGQVWTVTGAVKVGSVYRFDVEPATRIAESSYSFTFEYYVDQTLPFLEVANHNLGNANIRGIYEEDPDEATNLTLNDNGYGVDIEVQAARVPEDWDLLAFSR